MNSGSRTRFAMFWPRSVAGSSCSCASAVRLNHSIRLALSRITTPSGSACTARRMRASASAEPFFAPRRLALETVQRGEHFVPDALALGHGAGQRMGEPALQPGEVAGVPEQQSPAMPAAKLPQPQAAPKMSATRAAGTAKPASVSSVLR